MKNLLNGISFKTDDGKLADMFLTKAEAIAKKLNDKDKQRDRSYRADISTTQYRKFYDKVLELNEKAQGLTKEEFDNKLLPLVKMIVSKVAYSRSRKHCGPNFEMLMKESIKKVNTQEELNNFKLFLEAIIGFMPK